MKLSQIFIVLLVSAMLSACGGGGSSQALQVDQNLTVPLQAAFSSIAKKGLSGPFVISGWVDNSTPSNPVPRVQFSGNGTLTLGAAGTTTFNGIPALGATETITGTVSQGAQSTPIAASSTIYYDPNTFNIVGTSANGTNTVIAQNAIPQTVKAGATGNLGNAVNGSINETYSVAADSATSLLVTLISDAYDSFMGHTGQTQSIYRIDTSGNVKLVSITSQKIYLGSIYQSMTYTFQ